MSTPIRSIIEKRPLLISGPCGAETRDQLMQTARAIKETGKIDMLRAGIWKPRTKPGHFEGIGEPGLQWLQDATTETGLPFMVEVASTRHVELVLKYQIPVVWIGARTTVNPFYVQELAEALKGTGVPVFVKNPINPDADLWSGAVERFLGAGLPAGIIHRGFALYGNGLYRNPPMWNLPIEMKRRFPEVPLICDPSHICGNRSELLGIAQTAVDLGMDGLMIESHIHPDQAWSDARQQITPAELNALLDKIIWRTAGIDNLSQFQPLQSLRDEMDVLDLQLLQIMSKRMQLADAIGAYKKLNNITIVQVERFNEILNRGLELAKKFGLSENFIRNYFEVLHMESIEHQNKVMNE
ncbi:MAG: bifunctional 3-deoxy-7-phosphoheptulonate synthase/chorismate mutase type II [Ferruginibacter sp.]|nr:bifunctional 3-deoxy-7-phosphoheptulonate synthase/chorismate mutase type II [Ferruginibacter sp.]